jgi:hypothetical protein
MLLLGEISELIRKPRQQTVTEFRHCSQRNRIAEGPDL